MSHFKEIKIEKDYVGYIITQSTKALRRTINDKEILQQKIAEKIGLTGYMNILPRNFEIIPEIKDADPEDISKLKVVCQEEFNCYWMRRKLLVDEKKYDAEYKLYSYFETINDREKKRFFGLCDKYTEEFMTTHTIIQRIMDNPNFIEEVLQQ